MPSRPRPFRGPPPPAGDPARPPKPPAATVHPCAGPACDARHRGGDGGPMLVMKFGGSSVRGGRQLRAVAEIVAAHRPARPVVVASAMRGGTQLLLLAPHAAP